MSSLIALTARDQHVASSMAASAQIIINNSQDDHEPQDLTPGPNDEDSHEFNEYKAIIGTCGEQAQQQAEAKKQEEEHSEEHSSSVTTNSSSSSEEHHEEHEQEESGDTRPKRLSILSGRNFAKRTANGSWLVKFYAPWCGHCQTMAPTWSQLATQEPGIAKVNCDDHPELCQSQNVDAYPTIKLFRDGEVAGEYDGDHTLSALRSYLRSQRQQN